MKRWEKFRRRLKVRRLVRDHNDWWVSNSERTRFLVEGEVYRIAEIKQCPLGNVVQLEHEPDGPAVIEHIQKGHRWPW